MPTSTNLKNKKKKIPNKTNLKINIYFSTNELLICNYLVMNPAWHFGFSHQSLAVKNTNDEPDDSLKRFDKTDRSRTGVYLRGRD